MPSDPSTFWVERPKIEGSPRRIRVRMLQSTSRGREIDRIKYFADSASFCVSSNHSSLLDLRNSGGRLVGEEHVEAPLKRWM